MCWSSSCDGAALDELCDSSTRSTIVSSSAAAAAAAQQKYNQTLPIRAYLDQTVVPILLDGMSELV